MTKLLDKLPKDIQSFGEKEYRMIIESIEKSEHNETDSGVMFKVLANQAIDGDPYAAGKLQEFVRKARSPFLQAIRALESMDEEV